MCDILYKVPLVLPKTKNIRNLKSDTDPNDESLFNIGLEKIRNFELSEDFSSIIDEIFGLVQKGISIQKIETNLIDKIISASKDFDNEKIRQLLFIIECICESIDDVCYEFISFIFLEFLFYIIENDNQFLILSGLKCFTLLTEPGKSKCISKLDGNALLNKAFDITSTYFNIKELIASCLDLFSNLIINFDFSSEIYNNIENMTYAYIDSCEHLGCMQSAVRLMAQVSYFSPQKIMFHENYENTKRLYKLITMDENLANNAFSAINNLSYLNEIFAMRMITDTDILSFIPPDDWNASSISKLYRPLITLFSVVGKWNQLKKGGEVLDLCISKIIHSLKDLIPLLLSFVEKMQYKVKKKAIVVICQLVLVNNREIIFYIMTGHIDLFELFIEMLNMKDSVLITIVLKAIRTLIYFGDSIAEQMNYKNMFLEKAIENNIQEYISILNENFNNNDSITRQLYLLNETINICIERAEIDEANEDEYELTFSI